MSFDHVLFRTMPYSIGVEIGSDWQDKPEGDPVFGLYRDGCGFWTKGEIALLESIVKQFGGRWLEIGAHTGWCTYFISKWAEFVISIEPMFSLPEWYQRFYDNTIDHARRVMPWAGRSDEYLKVWDGAGGRTFDGCVIDGDHCDVNPLNDAIGCFARLNERGVILLHDFRGPDIWDAGKYLADQGLQWRVYPSVHMIFIAWRGDFTPPPDIQEGTRNWAENYGLPDWAK